MRNLRWTLCAFLLLPASLAGQSAVKVGVIDFQAAALQSNAGLQASQEIEARFQELNQGLQDTQAQLTEAQTRYETQQRALSAAALAQLEAQITRLQRDITRQQEDASLEMEEIQANLLNPVSTQVQQVVLDYAEEQRFTLILDASAGIVYASEAADITSEIVRRMNDAAGDAAPSPEPAPSETPEQPGQ